MKIPYAACAAAALAAVLAGCGTTRPSRFYSLQGPAAPGGAPAAAPAAGARELELAPVRVADYLRRPQLVLRAEPHRVEYLEFDRWAGALDEEAWEVLAESLAAQLGPGWRVGRETRGPPGPALRLAVEILQFEVEPGGGALLKVRWTRGGGTPRVESFRQPGPPGEAHRGALEQLAARLAEAARAP